MVISTTLSKTLLFSPNAPFVATVLQFDRPPTLISKQYLHEFTIVLSVAAFPFVLITSSCSIAFIFLAHKQYLSNAPFPAEFRV